MKISALAAASTVAAIAQAAPQVAPAAPAAPAPAAPNAVDGAAADAPIPVEAIGPIPTARLTPPRPDDYTTPTPTPTAATTMVTVTGTITATGTAKPTGTPTGTTTSDPQPKLIPGINEIPPGPPAAGPPPGAKPPVNAKPPVDDVDEAEPTIGEILIPNRLLNNAVTALDYISDRIAQIIIQINSMRGPSIVQITDSVRMPLESLESVLKAATDTAKMTGININTPVNLKEDATVPTCDGLCLLAKAHKIVFELSNFDNAAQLSGLDEVSELIKPVTEAAKALVAQLKANEPGNN